MHKPMPPRAFSMSSSKPTPSARAPFLGCQIFLALLILIPVVAGLVVMFGLTEPAPVRTAERPLVEPGTVARVSAEQAVKGLMNDPDSYSYVSHRARKVEIADGLIGYRVELMFRARNAFGGMVVNTAVITTDETGLHVLYIE